MCITGEIRLLFHRRHPEARLLYLFCLWQPEVLRPESDLRLPPSMGQAKATSRPLAITRRYYKYRQRINLGSYSTQAHFFSWTQAQVKLRLLRNISSFMYKSYFPAWVVTLHTELCRWAPRFTNTCTVCEELLRWFIQFLNFALFYFFKKATRLLFGKFFYNLILLYRSTFLSEFFLKLTR